MIHYPLTFIEHVTNDKTLHNNLECYKSKIKKKNNPILKGLEKNNNDILIYEIPDFTKEVVDKNSFVCMPLSETDIFIDILADYNPVKKKITQNFILTISSINQTFHFGFNHGKYLYSPIENYIDEIIDDFGFNKELISGTIERIQPIIDQADNKNTIYYFSLLLILSIYLTTLLLNGVYTNMSIFIISISIPLLLSTWLIFKWKSLLKNKMEKEISKVSGS